MFRLFSKKEKINSGIEVTSSLFYMPIPKVACTSIKTAIYALKYGDTFAQENHHGKHIHHFFERKTVNIKSYKHRVIIVRDPVKRFLSAFGNRVKFHGELNKKAVKKNAHGLEAQLPFFNPNLGQFIEHFDIYEKVPTIKHHCRSLSSWVGTDLTPFTHVYPIEKINQFEQLIKLQTNKDIIFPRMQEGGRKIPLHRLTEKHLNFLIEHFADDYQLLNGFYSREAIIKEWQDDKRAHNNKNKKSPTIVKAGAAKHKKPKL